MKVILTTTVDRHLARLTFTAAVNSCQHGPNIFGSGGVRHTDWIFRWQLHHKNPVVVVTRFDPVHM